MSVEVEHDGSPWHDGERAAQRAAGVAEEMTAIGRRNIRSFMPEQHRAFFAQLPFVVAAAVDKTGRPWASILSGSPGFATSPDPRRLHVAAHAADGDPLSQTLVSGAPIGVLGIDLSTRRRNRVNGRIVDVPSNGLMVAIEQSFGNCPKYIQPRSYGSRFAIPRIQSEPFAKVGAAVRTLIGRADTCFVASATPSTADPSGVSADISHRGGRPGFIHVAEDGALLIPDYRGNRYFNTLGNLVVNPRAGLLFIDFATGDLLQLTGTTEIIWGGPEVHDLTGAERLWRFRSAEGNWLRGAFPLRTYRAGEPIDLTGCDVERRRNCG